MARVERRMGLLRFVRKGLAAVPAMARCVRRFRNWPRIMRIYSGRAEFSSPFAAVARQGYRLTLWEPADVQTVWVVFCADSYRVPRPRGLVLDLGANIGAFSIFAARVLGATRVLALEPVTQTYQRLRRNIADNALEDTVETINEGIAGECGERTIHLGVSSPHASLFFRDDPRFESGQTERVRVTTLDALFERLGIEQVDICKMDCEGAEVEALLAASDEALRRIRFLCMEYHFQSGISDAEVLFARLRKAGFRCGKHDSRAHLAHFVRDGS